MSVCRQSDVCQGCAHSGRQWSGLATTWLKISTTISHQPTFILHLMSVVATTLLNLGTSLVFVYNIVSFNIITCMHMKTQHEKLHTCVCTPASPTFSNTVHHTHFARMHDQVHPPHTHTIGYNTYIHTILKCMHEHTPSHIQQACTYSWLPTHAYAHGVV